MSASLFYDYYADYESPENYIEYNKGDKTFGELKLNDIVYLYNCSADDILEVTIKGKLKSRIGKLSIKTKSFKLNPNSKYCKPQSEIEFGPTDVQSISGDHTYYPEKVKDSSLCASFKGGWAVGTNREIVLKYAKSDISNSIQKIQSNIENLQKEIELLNKKLENYYDYEIH